VKAEQRGVLTSACSAAKGAGDLQRLYLLDDLVLGAHNDVDPGEVTKHYGFKYLNFLASDLRVRTVPLDRVATLRDSNAAPLLSTTIFVTLSDGSMNDRFVTPDNSEDFTPGSRLHATAYVSHANALGDAHKLVKLMAELAAGVLFAALSTIVLHLRTHPISDKPLLQRGLVLVLPVVIALVVAALSLCLSAWLLSQGAWFNPLFMALGMALHCYVDAAVPVREAEPDAPADEKPSPLLVVEDQLLEVSVPATARQVGFVSTVRRVALTLSGNGDKRTRRAPRRSGFQQLSDWVDVDDKPKHRSKWDRRALFAWACAYYGVVLAAFWLAVTHWAQSAAVF
jgi:hypothetical protein